MDTVGNSAFALESIKGLWTILGIVATGIVSWIGYSIKDNREKKKSERLYREEQIKKQAELAEKVDAMIEWQIEFAKEQSKRLQSISEGLELCMEDDKLIFQAFRKSHLLNGESEAQSKKLEAYSQGLLKETLYIKDDTEDLEKLYKNGPN